MEVLLVLATLYSLNYYSITPIFLRVWFTQIEQFQNTQNGEPIRQDFIWLWGVKEEKQERKTRRQMKDEKIENAILELRRPLVLAAGIFSGREFLRKCW